MEEADQLSDRIGIIDQGKIIALDTPAALKGSINQLDIMQLEVANFDPDLTAQLTGLPAVENVATRYLGTDSAWSVALHTTDSRGMLPLLIETIGAKAGQILLGPSLTKLLTSLVFMVVAVVEYGLIFGNWIVGGNLALVLLIMLLVIPSIYGIGVLFGSLVIRFQEANTMVFLVRGIFMIFTGVSYPLAVIPGWMQAVAAWLPLTYAVHAIRAVTLGAATLADLRYDLTMLAIFAVGLSGIGYWVFRFTERRARRTGSLGRY